MLEFIGRIISNIVKKYLNIHKNDHIHDALHDAIEMKGIFQGLKDKYYEQALI